MRIGIAFDLIPTDRNCHGKGHGPDDRFEEFDRPETIEAIAEVLRAEGHEVVLLGDGPELLRTLLDEPPEFVWNMAEGQGTARAREARVPAVLEMLNIPYSGSDPLTLAAALDKGVAKALVAAAGVVVPWGLTVPPDRPPSDLLAELTAEFSRQIAQGHGGTPTWILKPAFEGSSKGIRGRCLAESAAEATAIYGLLASQYQQPILIEAFVPGDEVTVGIVGNGQHAAVLGAMRITPRRATRQFVYSLEVKRDWANQVAYETPARLPDDLKGRLFASALRAYHALGCRDLARLDFRISPNEPEPYFLEANPLPGLAPETSDLVIMARGYGISHADLIRLVLHTALSRVGPTEPVAAAGA